jgi:hypothetical protein
MCSTEPIARKRLRRDHIDSSDDEMCDLYYLIQYVESQEFSVVKNKQIKFDKNSNDSGQVKFQNRTYKIVVLKRGSEADMNKKAMRYQNKQPLSTDTDNEAVAKRHKKG